MRPIQSFSQEYLSQTRKLSPEQVLRFLEEFRQLHAPGARSILISMKVPEPLLRAFKERCRLEGHRYQTQIKKLMSAWLEGGGAGPTG